MSDLLSIGRSGVLAYRDALATTSENVVNADTQGYARRRVTLQEQSSPGDAYSLNKTRSALSGVTSVDVQRVWDQYKAESAWTADSEAGEADTRAKWLSSVETMMNDSDTGVGTKFTAVFTSANALAASPTDPTLRQNMLAAIGEATGAMQQTDAALGKVATSASMQANQLATQTNTSIEALANVNTALRAAQKGTQARAQLEDQRDSLISQISANIGVDVTFTDAGSVSLRLGGSAGLQLVSGDDSSFQRLNVVTAADGRLALTAVDVSGNDTAAFATTGGLAGLVSASATLAGRRDQLNLMAADFVTGINAWQKGGYDQAGVAGADLLTGTDAASIGFVTPAPDGTKIAASANAPTLTPATPPAVGTPVPSTDNGNIANLASLRDSTGIEARWRSMVTDQALIVSSANAQSKAAAAQKDGADSALDAVSGVSLDSEAADLLRFQQAYSASSKIIQTARETFQSVLDLF